MLNTAIMKEEDMLANVQPMLRNFYIEQEQFIANNRKVLKEENIENFYNNLETVLNIVHPKINLVDIGHQKSELKCFGPLLHNAVRDTTCPVGEHYLNGDNIGKVIDFYCSAENSKGPFKDFLTHKNFKSLVQNTSSQRAVYKALNSSIKTGKLTKLFGDSCREIIEKATVDLFPKDQDKLLSQIGKSQSRLPEAKAINAWGTQPDESRQNVGVSKEDTFKAYPVKAESVGGEEFKFADYSKLTIASIALTGLVVFGFVIASLATAGAALMPVMIGATVGSAVLGGGASVYLRSSDKSDFEKKQAEVAVAKDSAYQDHGQYSADLRKGPPYAERAENVRGSDRSNERGGRY
jgi:hypothetical protein